MKLRFISLAVVLASSNAFALLCPGNFSHIELGDSLSSVVAKCGEPTKKETKPVPQKTPQEWSYLIPQTVSAGTTGQQQGTLKATITFDADGKAINITVNGIGVGASTICGNNISLGNDTDAVKAACGKPSFINQQPPPDTGNPNKDMQTIYTYQTNPPTTFVFKDGVLSEVQGGR